MRTRQLKTRLKSQLLGPKVELAGLPDEVARPLQSIGRADLVVGIPTFNHADGVGTVVDVLGRGLVESYRDLHAVVMVSDGGSTDATRQVAMRAPLPAQVDRIVGVHPGPPGKGRALRMVFHAARFLQARACLVVEPDVRSVREDWVPLLAQPVLDGGFDLVVPGYVRYPQDNPVNDLLAYPLTRALYAVDLRHPLGGDYALSYFFVRDLLDMQRWDNEVGGAGVDGWACTIALAQGRRIAEAGLGLKVHSPEDHGPSLPSRFRDQVSTLLKLNSQFGEIWRSISAPTVEPPRYGAPREGQPVPVPALPEELLDGFKAGLRSAVALWDRVLEREVFEGLVQQALAPHREPFFPYETWARIVYDFLIACRQGVVSPTEAAEALFPIFQAVFASFVLEVQGLPAQASELEVQEQALVFEQQRDYLLTRWEREAEKVA